MIYKNLEITNIADLDIDESGVTWYRFPKTVYETIESENGKIQCIGSTGVELRFVMKSDKVTIKMQATSPISSMITSTFHIFRGGIQGGFEDSEINKYVPYNEACFEIHKSKNLDELKQIAKLSCDGWDPEVVRVIFDRGRYKIIDVIGDIEPPRPHQCPSKIILNYGSSITHGSNSLDISHSWPSVLAHNLKMDNRNLGMAGSCALEPSIIDYIASQGEKGNWNIATLGIGINVLDWDIKKMYSRCENAIKQIAGRNADKPVFIISPILCYKSFDPLNKTSVWRDVIKNTVNKLNLPNVTLINGLDLINDYSLISADSVHPNIYGVQQIAEKMTKIISEKIK